MRKMFGLLAMGGLIALVASESNAQRPGGGFQFGGRGQGGFGLLQNKGVQEELKITEEQKDKIKTASDEIRKKYPSGFGFGKKDNQPSKEDREKTAKERNEATAKAIAEILTKEQAARLKQIERQQSPATTLSTDEDVQKVLALSDEQKQKIKDIIEENTKQTRELFGGGGKGGFNKDAFEKIATLRKELTEKSLKVLTEDQTKKWKDLTGAPFEVRFEGFGGGTRPMQKKKDD